MLTQTDLFSTGIICDHCRQDPGRHPDNSNIWNGFLDKDTNEHVCHSCGKVRKTTHGTYYGVHYSLKQKKLYAGTQSMTFSEMPVVIK